MVFDKMGPQRNSVAMQRYAISLAIITLNEEKNIERCITSVPFVDEVIVVDSGSRDRTAELARGLGAKVINNPWQGYAKQKIFATSLCKNDWVLSLDADEALSPGLTKEILELLSNSDFFKENTKEKTEESTKENTVEAYAMPRLTHHLGMWMRHNGMYPDFQTRLYNRKHAYWLDINVHERVVAKNITKLKQPILHWSFDGIAHQIETINKYSSLRARDFQNKGKKFSRLKMVGKMLSKFFETYVLKQGFRDGVPGLIVSVVSSFSTFLRWAKLYEIEMNTNKENSSHFRSKNISTFDR